MKVYRDVNSENMFMLRYQNEEQNHNVKIVNKTFQNTAKFKHLDMTASNQNYTHEEVKRKLNSTNGLYNLFQNLVPAYFLTET
jgi:CobQ-like glutamine amidotransferase family enzyme